MRLYVLYMSLYRNIRFDGKDKFYYVSGEVNFIICRKIKFIVVKSDYVINYNVTKSIQYTSDGKNHLKYYTFWTLIIYIIAKWYA